MSLDAVFETVAHSASDIRDTLGERRSYTDAENPSGEAQLAADVYADDLLGERLLAIEDVATYASEERAEILTAAESPAAGTDGALHVTCDPLDGSSNLQSNNGMGTIVGVFDRRPPAPGSALLAAGYVLYGPITTMVTARDGRAREFLVEDGHRTVLDDDLTLPEDPTVYGFGGRIPDWPEDVAEYVATIEKDRLKLRYGGAMVADVNQVLTYGGIFGYPMLVDHPDGKLRHQFEGIPMAALVEAAGGASSDGEQSLLATSPEALHERSPVFVGNEGLIERLEGHLSG